MYGTYDCTGTTICINPGDGGGSGGGSGTKDTTLLTLNNPGVVISSFSSIYEGENHFFEFYAPVDGYYEFSIYSNDTYMEEYTAPFDFALRDYSTGNNIKEGNYR